MHFFNRIAALGAGLAMFTAVPVQAQQAERTKELYHIFDIRTQVNRQELIRALTDGNYINASESETVTPLIRGTPPAKAGTSSWSIPLPVVGSVVPARCLALPSRPRCSATARLDRQCRTPHPRITEPAHDHVPVLYTNGYHLDVYGLDTEDRGGGISLRLGRLIAGAVVGDAGD